MAKNCFNPATRVRRIAPVLSAGTSMEVLELAHTLCKNRKICTTTEFLQAHLLLSPSATTLVSDGVYVTEVTVSGKLLYQPVSGCGGSCGCASCPEEDVIFAQFKVYTDSEHVTITACSTQSSPIKDFECQDYTNKVLIALPYSVLVEKSANGK